MLLYLSEWSFHSRNAFSWLCQQPLVKRLTAVKIERQQMNSFSMWQCAKLRSFMIHFSFSFFVRWVGRKCTNLFKNKAESGWRSQSESWKLLSHGWSTVSPAGCDAVQWTKSGSFYLRLCGWTWNWTGCDFRVCCEACNWILFAGLQWNNFRIVMEAYL